MARVGRRGTGNYGKGMEVSSVNSVSKRSWPPLRDLTCWEENSLGPLSEWSGSGGQSRAVWLLGSPLLVEGLRAPVSRVSPAGALLQCRLSRGGAGWSRWRASGRYRQTEEGRACRREQAAPFS